VPVRPRPEQPGTRRSRRRLGREGLRRRRMRLDRDEQRALDRHQIRWIRHARWIGQRSSGRQHRHELTKRDVDDCRPDFSREPGRSDAGNAHTAAGVTAIAIPATTSSTADAWVHVHNRADDLLGCRGGRIVERPGANCDRVRLGRNERRHVDYRLGCLGYRQRIACLRGGRQYGRCSDGPPHNRRPDARRHASRGDTPTTELLVFSPASQSITGLGGTGTIAVSTTASCSWSATSNDGWITITAGGGGSGNGNVSISIAPNLGPARVGTVTVAGKAFTVNQAAVVPGPNCTYSIDPTSKSFNEDGATNQKIDVKTQGGCAWTAISNASWITVASGQIGVDDGEVRYNVAANPVGTPRQGTMTVAGKTFTVDQDATPCSFTIDPTSQTIAKSGGPGTVSVTTIPGCSWTATSQDSWIVVTAGGSGTGNGTVTYTVASNPGGSRKGTIRIAGRTFTVQQN
jgi:hypothetical protein